MRNDFPIPPCPDPEKYVLIRTKEGNFWRKKRGMGEKQAVLNEGFKVNSEGMSITAPAAKRIVNKLRPYLNGLATGRLTVKISAMLRKQLNRAGVVDYTYFKGFDFQPNHPIENLLMVTVDVTSRNESLELSVPIDATTIKQHNRIVTNYFFELIIVSGDCTKDAELRIESESSNVYAIKSSKQADCKFSVALNEKNWFAVLKVCCIEENEMAVAPRNYGMKVIAVG